MAEPSDRPGGTDRAPTESTPDWDAGGTGCGELLIELRARLAPLPPDAPFHLVATDPGAIEDLPAWCRLTGHRLLRADPPHFYLSRRTD